MAEESRKIMILNYDSKATERVKEIFPDNCDVATSDSLKDISEKADEDFDMIITGYLVPEVSGGRALSYLQDIQKALDEAKSGMKEKRDAHETLMRKAQEKQNHILAMLNDHVRAVESDAALLKTRMERMTEEMESARKAKEEAEKNAETALKAGVEAEERAEAAVKAKEEAEGNAEASLKAGAEAEERAEAAAKARAEAEKRAEDALREKERAEEELDKIRADDVKTIDNLKNEVMALREELERSGSLLEQANAEKGLIEEKLLRLQENWKNYMAGQ